MIYFRRKKQNSQKKADPLLNVATVDLSHRTPIDKDDVNCNGPGHYPRDYAYRQQIAPLMGNQDCEQNPLNDTLVILRNPDGSYPPPYETGWNGGSGPVPSSGMLRTHTYVDSPGLERHVKPDLPLPDPPVYFELDSQVGNGRDFANSAHAMALKSHNVPHHGDYGEIGRYSA